MKLEVGKTYVSRAGNTVKITAYDTYDKDYPYQDENDEWYTTDGRYWITRKSDDDLVAEVATPEEPSVQPTKPLPDIIDPVINRMCWDMVKVIGTNNWFDELKPALYEALKRYHKEYLDKPE